MDEQIPPKETSTGDSDNSQLDLQFEYAWRYFDFHAKQRTTMFNFFLVFSGFFISACATLLGNKAQYFILLVMLVLGALITLIFIFLERRNEELVHVAEDVLRKFGK